VKGKQFSVNEKLIAREGERKFILLNDFLIKNFADDIAH